MSAKMEKPLKNHNLFKELLRLRDEQRRRSKNARIVVDGEKLPRESNELGTMKWYLHPSIKDTALRTLLFWVHEIPPHGKSGRFKTQGGTVIYVWQGSGRTSIDDEDYAWVKGDVVQIPIRPTGVVVQHFNEDKRKPAKLVCCEVNTVDSLGVDKGSGFEVLEACPEISRQ